MTRELPHFDLTLLRVDGRRWDEIRKIEAKISAHHGSDGTCYLEAGNTKIACTVSRPAEMRQVHSAPAAGSDAQVQVKITNSGSIDSDRQSKRQERSNFPGIFFQASSSTPLMLLFSSMIDMRNAIASALSSCIQTHLYTRSMIVIELYVLSRDGSLLAACINAGILALLHAGIPMSGILGACTVGYRSNGVSSTAENLLLDPNGQEEQEASTMTVVSHELCDSVAYLAFDNWKYDVNAEQILFTALEGCRRIRGMISETVETDSVVSK